MIIEVKSAHLNSRLTWDDTMRDYVNVKKPSSVKMWAKKNRLSIRYALALAVIVSLSMLGAA